MQAQPQAPGQQQAAFVQQQQALAQRAAQQASQGALQAAQRPGQQTEAKGSEGAGEEPRRWEKAQSCVYSVLTFPPHPFVRGHSRVW